MPWDLLIRGGDVVAPDGVRRLDVAVENGTIVELAPELPGKARETVDAAGLHAFPGVIDPHVHFNEPGRTEWEGFTTGSSALAAGGGTCFFDMPLNSSPPTLDGESFDLKLAAARANSFTDFALWGGLTPNNLDKLEELAERGVVGFKAFMCNSGIDDFPAADDYTLFRGMQIAQNLNLPVAVHAENDAICNGATRALIASRRVSTADFLASRPVIAEVEAIQRALLLARETGCALHVVHISSIEGVNAILEARRRGCPVDVTCETCPHYFTLTSGHAQEIGARAKCAPPLRDDENRRAMRKAVRWARVDMVGSDHSPAPIDMKTDEDIFKVWGGIAGVQSTLPAMLSMPARPELETTARLTAGKVAARFSLTAKGQIEKGFAADLALVNVDAEYSLARDMLLDRNKLSPYVGRTFRGVVKRTIVRGHTVFRDGRIVAGDFRGRLVTPARREGGGRA